MGRQKRVQIKYKQKLKRKKRRKKLKKKGLNPDDFYCSGIYIGPRKK